MSPCFHTTSTLCIPLKVSFIQKQLQLTVLCKLNDVLPGQHLITSVAALAFRTTDPYISTATVAD
jgi:hypothetical protein